MAMLSTLPPYSRVQKRCTAQWFYHEAESDIVRFKAKKPQKSTMLVQKVSQSF